MDDDGGGLPRGRGGYDGATVVLSVDGVSGYRTKFSSRDSLDDVENRWWVDMVVVWRRRVATIL